MCHPSSASPLSLCVAFLPVTRSLANKCQSCPVLAYSIMLGVVRYLAISQCQLIHDLLVQYVCAQWIIIFIHVHVCSPEISSSGTMIPSLANCSCSTAIIQSLASNACMEVDQSNIWNLLFIVASNSICNLSRWSPLTAGSHQASTFAGNCSPSGQK